MVSRAKSQSHKQHITPAHKEEAIADAICQYNENKEKPKDEQKSLWEICREVQEKWRTQKHNKHLIVSHDTVNSFATCHADHVAQYWSSSLDTARGRAVNPCMNIEEDCIWVADETGLQPGGRPEQCVFGPAKKKTQHQQRDKNYENITVMVTICADGKSIPPLAIYKGQAFSTNWHQDNELKARDKCVAHSQKGWTDGVIGQLWIRNFDQKTQAKVNGHAHLLLVDGHNFHYMKGFLDYARDHKIHVLCYPGHVTHVYQGLDVTIFGVLKNHWSDEQNQHESSAQQKAMKVNFISIYGCAHHAILIPENIFSAFKATGVWPFNPKVVTAEMMAPSLETSSQNQCHCHRPVLNKKEATYKTALLETEACEAQSKAIMLGMQSSIVLQGMFCERLSSQLAGQGEK
ncbi:DDE-domain-containing protein [Gyrodon lividus]|nr:DDE-domain-containing protein [Gyrodon lividus]